MIRRFGDGAMLVSGTAGNVKAVKTFDSGKRVGEFSVNADYRDGAAVWVTVKAWGYLADTSARVCKGDSVLVTGRYNEREYNGEIYKECIADCIIGAQPEGEALDPPAPPVGDSTLDGFEDVDNGELPF